MIVLTYEPTDVFDVLLISEDGTPVSSHIELFETDEILISGFFTALGSVNEELSKDSGLKSIKRGEQEILIEKGVYTQLIILADRDQITIRREIQDLHREFEISTTKEEIVKVNQGIPLESADKLVRDIGELNVKFTIPQQTKWISTLSIALGPFMLILIGIL